MRRLLQPTALGLMQPNKITIESRTVPFSQESMEKRKPPIDPDGSESICLG
jgi:hypothetical protein